MSHPARSVVFRLTALLALTLGAALSPAWAAVDVATTLVQMAPGSRSLELDGTIEPLKQATVAAQVGGSVLALSVKAGDHVKAGQILASIDARVASAGVAQSDAAVAQAEASLRNARTQLDRTRELRTQGYMSQAALDNAENQFKAAEAAVQQAQAGRSQATLARGFASVIAPFDGLVLATHLDTGDLAAPGRPVVTVYAPGALRAVVQVPASQAGVARASQRIEVQLSDQRWVSPVKRTDLPTADPVSQTVEWRLDLGKADGADLLPGQTVRVRFAGAPASGATSAVANRLSVPLAAVLQRGELTGVYVAQGQQFVLRAVRTGAVQGDQIQVLAGLKAGERIALDAVRAGLQDARPIGDVTNAAAPVGK
jgi:RND family efflux transporter MFP subunit